MGSHSPPPDHMGSPTHSAAALEQELDAAHPWSPYPAQGGRRVGAGWGPTKGLGEGRGSLDLCVI